MFNEEGETETDDLQMSQSVVEYVEEEEEEEFQKIRKEHVFAQIDYTKRKSKIVCTLG